MASETTTTTTTTTTTNSPTVQSNGGPLLLPVKSRLSTKPVDPLDNTSHAVIYRYAIGDDDGSVKQVDVTKAVPREDISDFFYPHLLESGGAKKSQASLDWLNQRRDVFLLGLAAVQALQPDDKWSYYQIAAIHGLPHIPYDGDEGNYDPSNPDWWGGYCQHGSPLFPTWHRPYVMLLEQSIIRQVKLLASTLSVAEEKQAVLDIAEKLRFPYWDCASKDTQLLGFPDVFTSTTIDLAYAWKSFSTASIPNPLKAYVLPRSLAKPFTSSDVYNPPAKPNYVVPPSGTPFTPQYYPTVRYVDSNYQSNVDKLNVAILTKASTTLVEGIHGLFQHTSWLPFSNHYWSEDTHGDGSQYGHYTSIELVHDSVHTTVGGTGGHMAYTEIAAFDPFFFFHHCNVDRVVALWQYCYPGSWIPVKDFQLNSDGTYTESPESEATEQTPLTPFRRAEEGATFVTSNDVRLVDADCGYTYPEILRARKERWSPPQMLKYIIKLYEPPQTYVHRWVLMIERILKRAFNKPFTIRVFIGKPDANAKTPTSIPNYAGEIDVFARATATRCANCERHVFMRGTVDLSKTMVRLGITSAVALNADPAMDEEPPANPFAVDGALTLVLVDLQGELLDPSTAIAGWEGPKASLYYQVGSPPEEAHEFKIESFQPKVIHKFVLTSSQILVAGSK